jgi:hypothetical protein
MTALYFANKTIKSKKMLTENFLKELDKLTGGLDDKVPSVNKRFSRIKEIINEQLDLQSYAEGPQKNSMDGKNKNSMIRTIKSLEEEKNDIFRSIINDGHDPKITVMGLDGVVTEMKLSEFMAIYGVDMSPPPDDKAASTKKNITTTKKTSKSSKFIVHKGGKNDSEGTSH